MSENIGLLFPGQGAQFKGMGADLYERYPAARQVYDRAEEVLELPVRRLSFEGPEEELRLTRFTQPAILVHSLAALAVLPEMKPALTAGHSLGEYSALYAAGVLDLESVLRLVRCRAELMYSEGERQPGTMAAVLGLDAAAVEAVCRETPGTVVPANYNEPRQTVISGEVEAVRAALELARARGALKTVMLPVSGAFHSPLLNESAREFADFIMQFDFRDPAFPVIANVTGQLVHTGAAVRSCLARQLTSPVRWVETMNTARAAGCLRFFEVGPGQVLAGLARRIDRSLVVLPAGKVADMAAFVSTQEQG